MLSRVLLVFGLMLMLVASWLYRAAPPSAACMALPLLKTPTHTPVVRWPDGTLVELGPPDSFVSDWQHGWVVLRADGKRLVMRVRPNGTSARAWLSSPYPYNTLLAWDDGVYFMGSDDTGATVYHTDIAGRHVQAIAQMPPHDGVSVLATLPHGLIFAVAEVPNRLLYLDTRNATVTDLGSTPNATTYLYVREPNGQRLLIRTVSHKDETSTYWVVSLDGKRLPARVPPSTPDSEVYRTPIATLFRTRHANTNTLWRFDWDTATSHALTTFEADMTWVTASAGDTVWLVATTPPTYDLVLHQISLHTGASTHQPTNIEMRVAWHPNERRLYYISTENALLAMDIDTGVTTTLVPETEAGNYSISPCGNSYTHNDFYHGRTYYGRWGAAATAYPGYYGADQWLALPAHAWHPTPLRIGGLALILVGLIGRRRWRGYSRSLA